MTRKTILAALALVIAGTAGGYFAATIFAPEKTIAPAGQGGNDKGEPLFYRHPMNPEITSPVPAKDEMGMDYIPVYANGEMAGAAGTVRIDPVTLQNIGVRTVKADAKPVTHIVQAPGRIAYDETRLTTINARTEGWVEKQYVQRAGDFIQAGAPLLELYSPELVSSQQEYLLALDAWEAQKDSRYPDIRKGAEDLVALARRRLELLNVSARQIRELEETRTVRETLQITSPFSGTVLAVGVREGQHITPATDLYRLAELKRVWVMANIFEYELPWVREGAPASFQLDSLPGQTFTGTVDYIYPYLNPTTRTVQVRIVAENPDLALRPDAFANVTIESGVSKEGVFVPLEAVLRSGVRNRVFVALGEGRFEPRVVETGVVSDGEVEIVSGLTPGEEVVTSGQFLLDSESRLAEALSKMTAGKEGAEKQDGGAKPEGRDHD